MHHSIQQHFHQVEELKFSSGGPGGRRQAVRLGGNFRWSSEEFFGIFLGELGEEKKHVLKKGARAIFEGHTGVFLKGWFDKPSFGEGSHGVWAAQSFKALFRESEQDNVFQSFFSVKNLY